MGPDVEALALRALSGVAMSDSGAVEGVNETVEITMPQSAYSPQGRSSLQTL